MSNFQLEEYPWKPYFSNYTKFKQKTFNYIQRPWRNFHFEVAVWRYFFFVAQLSWHSLLYNVRFSIRGVPMEAKLVKLNPNWNKKHLARSKNLLENFILKALVTLFFRRCPAKLTFLALQCPIFNQRSTHGNQTSKITPNSNKKPLTISKDLWEIFSLKLLCDVISLSLSSQFGIPCFTMSNFQSEEYPWKRNFSNYTKFKQKTFNYIEKPFSNFHFEVAVWRHFFVVARPIWHSLLCNVQFSIR